MKYNCLTLTNCIYHVEFLIHQHQIVFSSYSIYDLLLQLPNCPQLSLCFPQFWVIFMSFLGNQLLLESNRFWCKLCWSVWFHTWSEQDYNRLANIFIFLLILLVLKHYSCIVLIMLYRYQPPSPITGEQNIPSGFWRMARGLEEEPWRKKEFFEMSRRQQNVQIYEV